MPFFVVNFSGKQMQSGSTDPAAASDLSPLLLSCLGCRLVRAGLARAALLSTRQGTCRRLELFHRYRAPLTAFHFSVEC
jgi:hypothetical protein